MDNPASHIKDRNIFISGGSGFIASHIIEHIVEANRITVFDNNRRNALKNTSFLDHPNVSYVQGDVRDLDSIRSALGDCDTVIHCAAIAGIDSVGLSGVDTMEVNLIGTYNMLQAVRDRELRNFIDFSTSEVYGPHIYKGTEQYLTSQGPVNQVRWTYAVSKLAAEHMSHAFHSRDGIPVTSVRPFNVYGPRQVGEGAIQKFILSAVTNKDITINGDGAQIRAWCYVDDFIDVIYRCLLNEKAIGESFNIGTPQAAISIAELARLVVALAGSTSKVTHRPALDADVQVRVPSIEKAQTMLGYEPRVNLGEGIERTIAWYRENDIT